MQPFRSDPQSQRLFQAAAGYLQLEMPEEAAAELEEIGPADAAQPPVVALWLAVWEQRREWSRAAELARALTVTDPDCVGWIVALAYATRRSTTIEEARQILAGAAERFPEAAVVQYNLACYACQMDELERARTYLRRAFRLDPTYTDMARTDSDLVPLRAELRELVEER